VPRVSLILLIAMALSLLGPGLAARAQFDGKADPFTVVDVPVQVLNRPTWSQAQFDSYLFGKARTAAVAQGRLEAKLDCRLDAVVLDYALTPAQRAKLALAGRGDIKHFLSDAEDLRRRFAVASGDRDGFRACLAEATCFQKTLDTGIFNGGSLFAKIMARTVTADQIAHAHLMACQREAAYHREAVGVTVRTLARALSLSAEQRSRFEALLLEETHPPARSGDSHVAFVMFQAARLSRAKLHPIFDDEQWRMLRGFLSNYENLEEFLKDDGFVFEKPASPLPAETTPMQKISRRSTK
jgi:hypothetical protein